MLRKTPDSVSRARQKIKKEMEVWVSSIKRAGASPQQIEFAKGQLGECGRQMSALRVKGKKKFWQR